MRSLAVLGILAAPALAASPAAAQVEIKLGHVLGESHSWHVAAKGFAKDVFEGTTGRVNIAVLASGQLGDEAQMVAGLRDGSRHAGLLGCAALQAIEPKIGIVELPYAWPTREHAHKALDGQLGAALGSLLDAKGIVVLSWWEGGFRHITGKGAPIRVPGDLRGLKINVAPGQMRMETFRALGAEPQSLAAGEVYSALRQGRLQAQEGPLSAVIGASFFEVQESVSLSSHVWSAACLVLAKETWSGLEPTDRDFILRMAAGWSGKQRKLSADAEKSVASKLADRGMAVAAADRPAFVAAVQPVWAAFGAAFGPELMGLMEQYRK
ncbi:MAG: DctP family TRAP transporter solute-binding subunit [Alphaproteobacteria bacterium]|nr:DctP family TRAP transporter solute-binding subunit [Alphaproteobacteria bacterium]